MFLVCAHCFFDASYNVQGVYRVRRHSPSVSVTRYSFARSVEPSPLSNLPWPPSIQAVCDLTRFCNVLSLFQRTVPFYQTHTFVGQTQPWLALVSTLPLPLKTEPPANRLAASMPVFVAQQHPHGWRREFFELNPTETGQVLIFLQQIVERPETLPVDGVAK